MGRGIKLVSLVCFLIFLFNSATFLLWKQSTALQEMATSCDSLPPGSSVTSDSHVHPKLFISGEDLMGVERIAQVWREAHPELRFTDGENVFMQHLFDKRSDQYARVPWEDMIAPYDVLYGRTVSFFFRDIVE